MRRASWCLVAGLVLASTSCLHRLGGTRPDEKPVELFVTNHYVMPVEVYAYGSGTGYRMGTVLPGLVSRFVLRRALVVSGRMVEFMAYPADGARTVRSGELQLVPGDIVDFEIATHLTGSVATVRP